MPIQLSELMEIKVALEKELTNECIKPDRKAELEYELKSIEKLTTFLTTKS